MNMIQPIEGCDETTLIEQLRQGVPAAFEICVRQHGPRLLAVAKRFFYVEQDCDDAVQDAFIAAFRAIGTFDGKSKLTTWLHRITINACLMKVRSRSRKSEIPIESLLPQFDDTGHRMNCSNAWNNDDFTQLAAKDSCQRVRDCIEQRPPTYREVLMLRDIEGMDTDEVSQILNCTAVSTCADRHPTRIHENRCAVWVGLVAFEID